MTIILMTQRSQFIQIKLCAKFSQISLKLYRHESEIVQISSAIIFIV